MAGKVGTIEVRVCLFVCLFTMVTKVRIGYVCLVSVEKVYVMIHV
jgi:hypothetical protein